MSAIRVALPTGITNPSGVTALPTDIATSTGIAQPGNPNSGHTVTSITGLQVRSSYRGDDALA